MTISRRDFLKASGLMAAWTALAACSPNAPTAQNTPHHIEVPTQTTFPQPVLDPTQAALLPTTTIPDGDKLLIHTLRRLTFGPTPEMFDQARRLGLDAFIEDRPEHGMLPHINIKRLDEPQDPLVPAQPFV